MATVQLMMSPEVDRAGIEDRLFCLTAILGGVGGAIAGSVVGSLSGTGLPTLNGGIGVILGSGLTTFAGQYFVLPWLVDVCNKPTGERSRHVTHGLVSSCCRGLAVFTFGANRVEAVPDPQCLLDSPPAASIAKATQLTKAQGN